MEKDKGIGLMKIVLIIALVISFFIVPCFAHAKQTVKKTAGEPENILNTFTSVEGGRSLINIAIMLTILAFAPAILLLMSAFTRIVIVFSLLRQALGIPQLPPNQVIIGLSLFLTFFIMAPTYEKVYTNAVSPYMEKKIGFNEFFEKSSKELNVFMFKYAKEKDLALFMNVAGYKRPKTEADIPMKILVPAFAISELKRAFQIGFLIYIPFLVIDMVIASVLLSAGMMMLPPIYISLPFKLMLFVLVDGWNLLVNSLIKGFY
ncbi:MAG TPA: flagellar type III secretion system pore protein FliP [Syntrophorhabdaceae bacterium]|nr:flagellar type III secretion system pore protein FliP [Syntrophorhabdaceae bacterium]